MTLRTLVVLRFFSPAGLLAQLALLEPLQLHTRTQTRRLRGSQTRGQTRLGLSVQPGQPGQQARGLQMRTQLARLAVVELLELLEQPEQTELLQTRP